MSKLVRDKIPQIIKSSGKTPHCHRASDREYFHLLTQKLQEEVSEFIDSNNPEELADILEVIHALAGELNTSFPKIQAIRRRKKLLRGGFNQRLILNDIE